MPTLRALVILTIAGAITPFGMILQALLIRVSPGGARWLPVLYHRFLCALMGVRIRTHGTPATARPLLLAANHVSWLDIIVLGALGPTSFVAKQEVATWPVFGWLARLQRTVFVDRERRTRTGHSNRELARRLAEGDVITLFAEGTSTDGNDVKPFKSALLGAVHESAKEGRHRPLLCVQPVAIAYTRLNGIPMGRQHRTAVAWFGDLELAPHLWRMLRLGTIDVEVAFGEPSLLYSPAERKPVAATCEGWVRRTALALNAGRSLSPPE